MDARRPTPLVDRVKRRAEKALSARVCEFMVGLQFEAPHLVPRLAGGARSRGTPPSGSKKRGANTRL